MAQTPAVQVADVVCERIERLIVDGVLKVGQALPSERRLTEKLGVSRTALREGLKLLRAKGIIDVHGEDRRLVFQAVHMILEGDLQKPWGDKERRWSRAVFIGRDLNEAELKAGFEACAA